LLRSPLLHFLLIGALLFALHAALAPSSSIRVIEVHRSEIAERVALFERQMGRAARPSEIRAIQDQVVDDALWLDQARALGLDRIDAVVRQRLVLNMRFLEGGDAARSDDELYARALELGLDRSDTVVKRRLIDRVQAIVRAGVRAEPPDEATLRAYFDAKAERWREPPLLDLTHVYLSRDRRGAHTQSDAERLLQDLREHHVAPEAAVERGDPFLGGHRLRGATPSQLVSRLGPDFAAGVAEAETGRWIGPVESAFGSHLVWIHERVESRIPAFEEIRSRVLEDWIDEASERALRAQAARLRERVEIRFVDDPAEAGGAGGIAPARAASAAS
jgi:hypothetical protein